MFGQQESPPLDAHRQKKSRHARLGDHFTKANSNSLEDMKIESQKWLEHEQDFLAWDKEKHIIFVGLELKMHKESLMSLECTGTNIVGALREVFGSLKFFVEVMARYL